MILHKELIELHIYMNSNQREMDPLNKKQPLKKMIPQLLISVSLFSFLVSYSSLYHSSLSLAYPYFSANSFQLNKNCLFLICNGLLVFLAKTSGLIQPPTANDVLLADTFQPPSTLHKYILEEPEETITTSTAAHQDDGGNTASAAAAADGTIEEVSIFIAESEEEQGDHETGAGVADDDAEKDGNDEQLCRSCWLFDEDGEQLYGQEDDDDEDDEEDEEEEMSTEELNQKFEDFIRKMKEEIIINEARQKTLMLN